MQLQQDATVHKTVSDGVWWRATPEFAIIDQTFSVDQRFGERAGQVSCRTFSAAKKVQTIIALWFYALFHWNLIIKLEKSVEPQALTEKKCNGHFWKCRNTNKRWPRPRRVSNGTRMVSHTITPGGKTVWRYWMFAGNMRFTRCRQTRMRPLWYCEQKWDICLKIRCYSISANRRWIQYWRCSLCNIVPKSMLLQTSSKCSCRHLQSCKRLDFWTQDSWRGCTIH